MHIYTHVFFIAAVVLDFPSSLPLPEERLRANEATLERTILPVSFLAWERLVMND